MRLSIFMALIVAAFMVVFFLPAPNKGRRSGKASSTAALQRR